jgi:hypothetical protein
VYWVVEPDDNVSRPLVNTILAGNVTTCVVSVFPDAEATTQVDPNVTPFTKKALRGSGASLAKLTAATPGTHEEKDTGTLKGSLFESNTVANERLESAIITFMTFKFIRTVAVDPMPSAVGSLLQPNAAPATSAASPNNPAIRTFMRSSREGLVGAPT